MAYTRRAMHLPTFFEPTLDLERFRGLLDTSGSWARVHLVQSLSPEQLKVLFEAVADTGAMTFDDLVPGGDALVEVIHHGKNSLPVFNHFEKRFCRPDGDAADVLWGYNHNGALQMAVTGPGYFVATLTEKSEVLIDYAKVPPRKPADWPAIIGPTARAGSLVWAGMTDVLRKVSEHVSIGAAYKAGKPMGQYFALCRDVPRV